MATKINRRESAALINSLSAGVVPRIGLRHIAVGRKQEITALLEDLDTIEVGGSSFRFICGYYGSGKSFLLQVLRNNAMEKKFIVMDADLSPERRLTGTNNTGLNTYRELIKNLSTKTRPDGGALEAILQKWIQGIQAKLASVNDLNPNDPHLLQAVSHVIQGIALKLSELTYGYAFSQVLNSYWIGYKSDDENLKQNALRWIKGEYTTKTQAKKDLPVDCIIDDQNWYEFLKLFALFVHEAGYKGLLICIDEGVNLYKIANKKSRDNNYEKILTIFNDTMQGKAQYLGLLMSGTPQFIYDEHRGLFSYEALRSRLTKSKYVAENFNDYTLPVINLSQLTPEEMYVLLERLCEVHSAHYNYDTTLTSSELTKFLNTALSSLGGKELLTPRELTKDFLAVLNILHQNPNATLDSIIGASDFKMTPASSNPEETENDTFEDFEI